MRRFRYSAWDGTQALPDLDGDRLLREVADDFLTHGDLQAALRRLFKQGLPDALGGRIQGLHDMIEQLRERRRELLERYDPGGVLGEIAEALAGIRRMEEDALDRRLRQDPRDSVAADRLEELHRMPEAVGEQLRALQRYDFQDPDAEHRFQQLVDDLRRQAIAHLSEDLTHGLRELSEDQLQRLKDMMAELGEMVRQRMAGQEPDFQGFMQRHGDLFPDDPEAFDDLLRQIAERMARMQMLLASMTDAQRDELESVLDALFLDIDLQWQANELARNLMDAFPYMSWNQGFNFSGTDPLDLSGGMQVMNTLADMDGLEQFLGQAANPALLAEVDPDQVENLLGHDARRSLELLQQITQALEDAGLIEQREGRLELTPRGMRKLGLDTLAELFSDLDIGGLGEHEQASRGSLGEPAYTTRPYEFGDPFLLDVGRTVRNALVRTGPGTPVRVTAKDFEVEETECLARTATVLMLDLSLSMMLRDSFLAAKKVAIALHSLIVAKFPRDYMGIVGFSEVAREIKPDGLPRASYDYVYGTNMQHAFALARSLLARHKGDSRQIIMITDGEPTAHVEDGIPIFNYPPSRHTIEETLREVVRCTREKITINTFMLDASPALRRFVEHITQMNHGRAFFTTPEGLGRYVLVDFLEHKRRQRHN